MNKRESQLERLFLMGLSLAGGACAATPPATDGPGDAVGSASASVAAPGRSSAPVDWPHDDATPEGYARGYRSAPRFQASLSGLELQGFADVVDGKFACEGDKPCPAAWDKLIDGQFWRAAVVKKRGTLAVITSASFFEWIGPVDGPERAALRANVEQGRKTTTCRKLEELGFACGPGSEADGIPVRPVEGGFEVATFDMRNVCHENGGYASAVSLGALVIDRDGVASNHDNVLTLALDAKHRDTLECQYPVPGRRTEGVEGGPRGECSATVDYLARAAREEAAAVIAFERLAEELAAHGAPGALTDAARRAADDERRHAATFQAELERASASPAISPAHPTRPDRVRPLLTVLLENAKEGCANETYAAVVATHQGLAAPSARLRGVFRRIARDERRHAALSYRVHAWGRRVVSDLERRALDTALDDAVSAFAEAGATTPAGRALGEPEAAVARTAFTHVVAALRRGELRASQPAS